MKLAKLQRGYETLESRVSVACSVTRAEFLFAFCIAGGVGEARVGTRWRKIRAASECHLKMHASFSLRMSSRPCTPILHCDGSHRFHTRRLKSLPPETQSFQPFRNEFFPIESTLGIHNTVFSPQNLAHSSTFPSILLSILLL